MILLTYLSLGIQAAILGMLVAQFSHPLYRFRRWEIAWGALFLASLLVASLCIYTLLVPVPAWISGILLGISLCKVTSLWHFRAMFHRELHLTQATDAAWIEVDSFSVIVAWDAQAERLFGWTSVEACGQTLMQRVIPPRDWEAHRAGIARLLATGHEGRVIARTFAVNACRKQGDEIPVTIRVQTIPQDDGTVHFSGEIRELGIL